MLKISDHHAQQHGLPKGSVIASHRIVVEGDYWSGSIKDAKHGGGFEKKKVAYRETFDLAPNEAHLHEQNALAHILRDELPKRLRAQDKGFRAVATHHIAKHENRVTKPAPPAPPAPLRDDGPTPAQWAKAGYDMKDYPPKGYAAKEDVAAAAPPAQDAEPDENDQQEA